MRRLFPILLPLPALFLLIAWQGFVTGVPQRLFLFGSPTQIFQVALQELPQAAIWHDMGVTLSALLAGLALGTLAGTAGGLLLALHPVARAVSRPYLIFFGSVQIFTLAPLLVIWFGIGWGAKVAMAALVTGFVALQQAASGATAAEQHYLGYARSLKADPSRVMWHIILPGALHWVLAGLKLNIGFATLGVLVGEFISAEDGLGHYIFKASGVYDVPRVWFGVLLLCLMALALTAIADWATKRFLPLQGH